MRVALLMTRSQKQSRMRFSTPPPQLRERRVLIASTSERGVNFAGNWKFRVRFGEITLGLNLLLLLRLRHRPLQDLGPVPSLPLVQTSTENGRRPGADSAPAKRAHRQLQPTLTHCR